jgi:hypothetical protein|nr:MAG TPA: hypothetical protein [Caudoviricetes sp.]DAF34173.1 MAG TPA: hypothetical protein [Caudoviricetes sp.]DAQ81961.1 MAG TPA: hypothetical protein [Caudoviricetes sp.]
MTTKIALTGNGINTRNVFKQKIAEEILEEIRKAASKPKPAFVGYAQIGGETLKKVIYE